MSVDGMMCTDNLGEIQLFFVDKVNRRCEFGEML